MVGIDAAIGVDDGAKLIMAACAHIHLVKKTKVMARRAILSEMKSATGYYKPSYSKNLSNYLKSLVEQNKLLEPTRGSYSITAPELSSLRGLLGP